MQQSKIDAVVNKMIDDATNRGDGFILDLTKNADGENGFARIEVRTSQMEPDEFQRISDGRKHTICDTDSFIRYVKKYGHVNQSLIFYNQDGATLTIDEGVERGEREIILMQFEKSDEWNFWDNMIGCTMTHRDLHKCLNRLSHTIIDPEILLATRKMKMNVQVVHDSDLQEDDKTIGFLVKSSKGEDLKKFPKSFGIRVPVLDQDVVDETSWIEATVHLEIELPDVPTEPCIFRFSCPEWRMLMRDRILKEGKLLQDELEEFTIVHGHNKTFTRKIGMKENGLSVDLPR